MKFYTSVNQYGNNILVRGVNNGHKVQDRVAFKPSLYVPNKDKATAKSLFGKPLAEVKFDSINDAKEYVKLYKDVEGFEIYGNTNYAYQYISSTFKDDVEFDMSQLKIWTLDIETSAENGFPDVGNPQEKVLLITTQDYVSKQIVSFGLYPCEKVNDKHTYVHCKDEVDLLSQFLEYVAEDHPHIITGWNVEFFDIPYLCNRITKMLGDDALKKLSPWKVVEEKSITRFQKESIAFSILGIAILDYLDLYKKFTYGNQESYKLDHIAKVELGKEKLNYDEFVSFNEFWKGDWQKFVRYNVIDCELVDELEEKMKLIELILTMAYDAKCNYVDIFSAVRTWDCILYNQLLKKNIIVHQNERKQGRSIAGAYVQTPRPGKYKWVVSFDATSLYPSIIMQYNMSPETMATESKYRDIKVSELLEGTVDTSDLVESKFCMAANGVCYTTDKQGIFPEIVQKLFDDRKQYKKLMLVAQAKYEESKDKIWLKEISKYNNFQMARKIQMNSLFGAMANEFFRFYDDRVAEGITLSGQYIIQKVGKALNDYLNKICGTKDFEYSFYSDTDSCYVTLDPLVEKFYKGKEPEKIVDILDKICESKIQEVLNKVCGEISDYTNAFQNKIVFKREAIAETGVWVAKKRYALNVYNNEGITYKEPKLKVMGLEIVRSSTPEPIREALRKAVKLVLTSDENTLQSYILGFETEFRKMKAEDISFPRGVNGVEKYTDRNNIYKQATPMHVRGALLYNFYINKNDLRKKYELIKEGDKIKFVYLKEPNTIGENCIAFNTVIPPELDLLKFIDYEKMFDKSFLEPMNTILTGIGWSAKPQATLEGLFG
jgi:DNA polymerase elongation subunit (family B)